MSKITVEWDVNIMSGQETIDLEDIGVESYSEFQELTADEQKEKVQEYLDGLPNRTYIVYTGGYD